MEALFKQMEDFAKENKVPIINENGRKVFIEIIKKYKPQRVLEIGTAIGYSALLTTYYGAENAKIMGTATDPFYGAPVILIVLADKDIPTYQYDGSLVMGNLMNAAESLGLGSIWIHRAKEEFESDFGKKILADLGIEGNYEGIGHCAIGYAAAPANAPAPRKENYVYYVK